MSVFPRPDQPETTTIQEWREETFRQLVAVGLILMLPLLVIDVFNGLRLQRPAMVLIEALVYLGVALLSQARRVAYRWRAGLGLGAVYVFGAVALFDAGLVGTGRIHLAAAVVFAALLLGWRVTLGMWLLCLATYAAYMVAVAAGAVTSQVVSAGIVNLSTLFVHCVVALLLSGMIAAVIVSLVQRLARSLGVAQSAIAAGVSANRLLEERVAERTAALEEVGRTALEREATLGSFFNSASMMMGIVEITPDDIRHISDNAATRAFFGMPADTAYPYLASRVGVPPATIRLWLDHYERSAAAGGAVTFEYEHTGPDGAHWLAVTVSPIVQPDAPPNRFAYIVEDVTERHRTAEALLHSKEAAEAADRAKSAFLAHMSHEIRTPLNAVIGMSGLLLDTPLAAGQRDLVATIRTGGETLLGIINNILDLSKIESGHLELESQPFDLHACLEESIDLVALGAVEKGLSLEYRIEPSVPATVVGDMVRLRQVVMNLLANAIKFTQHGSVTLVAQAAPAGQSHTLLQVHVRDTGIGIAPEQLDHIFKPFAQAESTTTRRYGGTGLGLAISRQLVEAMGGTITVTSQPGQGSSFTISVPLRGAQGRLAPPAWQAALTGRAALVVCEEQAGRERLAEMVRQWGMVCAAHPSGQAAVAWVTAGGAYDGAIIVEQQPGDGPAIARGLRAVGPAEPRPAILVARAGRELAEAEQSLFAAVISQPLRRSRLGEALAGALSAAPEQPAARQDDAARALKILIAEDNQINQEVVRRMVERIGAESQVVGDGLAAVEAVKARAFDLILMDVQMPELDGEQATRRIRALGPTISQPLIVAVTASALAGDRERYLAAGMDDYVSKPMQLHDLLRVLGRLGLRSPQAPAPRPGTAPLRPPGLASDPSILDWSVLETLKATLGPGGAPTIARVLRRFREELPESLQQIGAAIATGDMSETRRLAHRIRGSSQQIGARALADHCGRLESAALAVAPAQELEAMLAQAQAAHGAAIFLLNRRYPPVANS